MTPEPAPAAPRTCSACGVTLERREHPAGVAADMGDWFDHPHMPGGYVGHVVSTLIPSPRLAEQLAEQGRAQGGHVQPTLPI